MGLKIITQPVTEPLTLDECRMHLNVQPYDIGIDGTGTHPHDGLIMSLQATAREYCENFTGLSLALKTYELALDAFPASEIELLRPPVVQVISVIYADATGALRIVDEDRYVLDDYQRPGWLLPLAGSSWPAAGAFVNAVKIRYVAGFGDDSDSEPLPYAIRAAMLLLLGNLYANREAVNVGNITSDIEFGVDSLLRPLRVRLGMA